MCDSNRRKLKNHRMRPDETGVVGNRAVAPTKDFGLNAQSNEKGLRVLGVYWDEREAGMGKSRD